MSPDEFFFGILSVLAIAVIAPVWVYFAGPAASGLPTITGFLVGGLLIWLVLFTLASWLQPG